MLRNFWILVFALEQGYSRSFINLDYDMVFDSCYTIAWFMLARLAKK